MPIQIQLSQEQKSFSESLAAFSNSTLNFEDFERKGNPHKFCISEFTDSENIVR